MAEAFWIEFRSGSVSHRAKTILIRRFVKRLVRKFIKNLSLCLLPIFLLLFPLVAFPDDGVFYMWDAEGVLNFSATKPSGTDGPGLNCADRKAALVELQQVKTIFLRDANGWWRRIPEDATSAKILEAEQATNKNCSM